MQDMTVILENIAMEYHFYKLPRMYMTEEDKTRNAIAIQVIEDLTERLYGVVGLEEMRRIATSYQR